MDSPRVSPVLFYGEIGFGLAAGGGATKGRSLAQHETVSNAGATYLDGCTALPRSCRAGQSGAAGGRGGVAQRQALCGPVCRWCSHASAVGCIIFTKSRSHSAVNRCVASG